MNDDVEEIKKRLNIVDSVQSYVPLRKMGSTWKGLCPFHQEKTPSFTVNEERQIYKCFGCSEAGDVIDFVMKMEHLTFPEALQMLADRAGVILDKRKTPAQYAQEKDEKSRLYKINRIAADVFHKILLEYPKADSARSYLESRGLNEETVKEFTLGYAPQNPRPGQGPLEKLLNQRGYTYDERKRSGNPERFSNRLVFPLWDALGNPIGFTGRALNPNDQPKYLNTPETPLFKKGRVLYPLHRAKDAIKASGRAILVEGQMDVLLSHQLGVKEAVATSGTALTVEHLEILKRYTSKVYFCFDMDSAGVEATRKALLIAYDCELESYVVTLPEGFKDLGELAVKDPEQWPVALKNARPAFVWQVETGIASVGDSTSAANKKTISKLALPLLARVKDPIEKAHWVQYLSRKLQVPERSIQEALERFNQLNKNKTVAGNNSEKEVVKSVVPIKSTPEEQILGLLLAYPEQIANIIEQIRPADFDTSERGAQLAETIKKCYNSTDSHTQSDFLAKVQAASSQTDKRLLDSLVVDAERLTEAMDSVAIAQEVRAGFERLRAKRTEHTKERIAIAISDAQQAGDPARVKALLAELQELLKD